MAAEAAAAAAAAWGGVLMVGIGCFGGTHTSCRKCFQIIFY